MLRNFSFYLAAITTSMVLTVDAQSVHQYPEVGMPAPDFILKNVKYYPTKTVTVEQLKGKFVILDFWNKYCVSCIQSFPKVNELRSKFSGTNLEIMLVGLDDVGIEQLYDKFQVKFGLNIPVAFDSVTYSKFVHQAVPQIFWIDPAGVIQAITSSPEFTEENIQAFIEGRPFKFRNTSYKASLIKDSYNKNIPFLFRGNGGEVQMSDVLYRSLLVPTLSEMISSLFPASISRYLTVYAESRTLQGSTIPLFLYNAAFTGKSQWGYSDTLYTTHYPFPLIEASDRSPFYHHDGRINEQTYWYSATVPESQVSMAGFMNVMQRDLEAYFGYTARLEKRVLPYWRLTFQGDAFSALRSKGGTREFDMEFTHMSVRNFPFQEWLKAMIDFGFQSSIMPVIDETGFGGNIDLDIQVDTTDPTDIKRAFKEVGIEMVKAEKEFQVIVIRDPASENESTATN